MVYNLYNFARTKLNFKITVLEQRPPPKKVKECNCLFVVSYYLEENL